MKPTTASFPYDVGKYQLRSNYWVYEQVYVFFWRKRVRVDTYLEGIKEVHRLHKYVI